MGHLHIPVPQKEYNRRRVLKSAAIGSLSAISATGLATATRGLDEDEAESVLEFEAVQAIERKDPQLELDAINGTSIGSGAENSTFKESQKSIISIPANHGNLIIYDDGNNIEATLYFDGHYPELDIHWPKGTTARLTATGDEATFQREATRGEKRSTLAKLGKHDLKKSGDVTVGVAPESGEYCITHAEPDTRVIESLTVRKVTGSAGPLEVVDRRTTSPKQMVKEQPESAPVQTLGCDCNNEAADVLFCLYQTGSCAGCFIFGIPVLPVAIACVLLSCVGGSGGVILSLVADLGCTDVDVGCVESCLSGWFGQFT